MVRRQEVEASDGRAAELVVRRVVQVVAQGGPALRALAPAAEALPSAGLSVFRRDQPPHPARAAPELMAQTEHGNGSLRIASR